ncbi:MAG: SEL1-like repeat protein [Nitrospira sp. SB0675_bin_23]|nr:SEL1-like repeat protein [Nitrospira sp. SB0667_bin_9]MYD30518.1 SEL1-like repeat protein [Nitrospira sp. SB0661_bin_20]MYH01170.1 SEL1-like repeat protein [Nitrospira sp. SB0675_bin_23]MYJ23750.1 SEL1-like repeat protein [Nitrospira sp. SB0673_bin_12]
MYAQGRGVPEDAAEAVRWFRRAAEQDHARAQWWLRLRGLVENDP